MEIAEQIYQFVMRHGMVEPGDRVAVAVSGGGDSVALLELLLCLRGRLCIELAVAHFDHRLRGAESDADARFVQALAARHGLPFYADAADVAAQAKRRRANLESVARDLRYQFLRSLVAGGRVGKVATGHTADDQAETVLARLVRGSGTRGLAGIYPIVEGWLIRPLLGQRRTGLRRWLSQRNLAWREDTSNLELRFRRNRLRREVLPLLEEHNPRLVEHLSATAEVARDEEEFWIRRGAELLSQHAVQEDQKRGVLKLSLARFAELSRAEQRRLLRTAVAKVLQGRSLDVAHVEALCQLSVAGQSGRRLALPGLEAVRVFQILELRGQAGSRPAPATPYEYLVPVPGACAIAATGTRLVFNLVGKVPAEQGYNLREASLIDADSVRKPLMVRNWRPGDLFDSPTGKGQRKIKTLLLERRIPAEERRVWPIVTSAGSVVWMRGFPVARPFRMRPESAAGILIREEGLADG